MSCRPGNAEVKKANTRAIPVSGRRDDFSIFQAGSTVR